MTRTKTATESLLRTKFSVVSCRQLVQSIEERVSQMLSYREHLSWERHHDDDDVCRCVCVCVCVVVVARRELLRRRLHDGDAPADSDWRQSAVDGRPAAVRWLLLHQSQPDLLNYQPLPSLDDRDHTDLVAILSNSNCQTVDLYRWPPFPVFDKLSSWPIHVE